MSHNFQGIKSHSTSVSILKNTFLFYILIWQKNTFHVKNYVKAFQRVTISFVPLGTKAPKRYVIFYNKNEIVGSWRKDYTKCCRLNLYSHGHKCVRLTLNSKNFLHN